MNKLILIGFMGAGKSTVAANLSVQLNIPALEMDELIISRSGFGSIPEIFAAKGEAFFRDLESEVARTLAQQSNLIISSGGGVIGRPENMEQLKTNNGIVIFLRSTFATVISRNGDLTTRPLFRDGKLALALFNERAPTYACWADITVDTDDRSIGEVCSEIVSGIESLACHPSPSPRTPRSA